MIVTIWFIVFSFFLIKFQWDNNVSETLKIKRNFVWLLKSNVRHWVTVQNVFKKKKKKSVTCRGT